MACRHKPAHIGDGVLMSFHTGEDGHGSSPSISLLLSNLAIKFLSLGFCIQLLVYCLTYLLDDLDKRLRPICLSLDVYSSLSLLQDVAFLYNQFRARHFV